MEQRYGTHGVDQEDQVDQEQDGRTAWKNKPGSYKPEQRDWKKTLLATWLMEPGGSMPHSQGLSNNPYPEENQPNSSHWYPSLQGPF